MRVSDPLANLAKPDSPASPGAAEEREPTGEPETRKQHDLTQLQAYLDGRADPELARAIEAELNDPGSELRLTIGEMFAPKPGELTTDEWLALFDCT